MRVILFVPLWISVLIVAQALNVYELQPSHQDAKLGMALTLHAEILDHLNGRKREAQAQRRRASDIMALH